MLGIFPCPKNHKEREKKRGKEKKKTKPTTMKKKGKLIKIPAL